MDKLKKIEPAFWVFLIVVAIITVIAVKMTYGF
jgi:hypothetical protein